MKKLNPIEFAGWLIKQNMDGCGYLMGAVGQYTRDIAASNWLVNQYRGNPGQYARAKKWLETAPRVFDCQGLADCYVSEMTGRKVNVYARNNFADWCGVSGSGRLPVKYRVPGAAVFMYSAGAGRITHVGFLAKPVDAGNPGGDWYVIDARGVMYGVVRTRLLGRSWNRWGLMDRYFDYGAALKAYHGGAPEPDYTLGSRALKTGMRGGDVKTLQELLMKLGYALPKFGADGDYGAETRDAVSAFKLSEGLKGDGVYGANAHEALMRAIEEDGGSDGAPGDLRQVRITAAGAWNVRMGPGKGYGIVTVVRQGAAFPHISTAGNGWHQMEVNGDAGWVSPKCAEVS